MPSNKELIRIQASRNGGQGPGWHSLNHFSERLTGAGGAHMSPLNVPSQSDKPRFSLRQGEGATHWSKQAMAGTAGLGKMDRNCLVDLFHTRTTTSTTAIRKSTRLLSIHDPTPCHSRVTSASTRSTPFPFQLAGPNHSSMDSRFRIVQGSISIHARSTP